MSTDVSASCHCGSVRLEVDAPPSEVTVCNCSLCRRYGIQWAYYPPRQVRMVPADPPTDVYMWGGRSIEFHRCRNCGCVSHWAAVDRGRDRMGVNARLMPPRSWPAPAYATSTAPTPSGTPTDRRRPR